MANPKEVLVLTSSSIDGIKVTKYLRPVSAHIVAGTNVFSDFLGGLTDVFGGRSQSYQKQLTSLYNEAIERIKFAAYELGGNCVIGLSIDMDEISGKGKSMFMLTAIGTAIVIEKSDVKGRTAASNEKYENVSVERVDTLRTKKGLIEKAREETLSLSDEVWEFITVNQVDEVFPFILKKYTESMQYDQTGINGIDRFHKLLQGFVESLEEDKKLKLIYNAIATSENDKVALKLSEIVKELALFNYELIIDLFNNENFKVQKRTLRLATFDKPFYNSQDVENLHSIVNQIEIKFIERGKRSLKKQLLSNKEKEVWICECGKTNDMQSYCNGCHQDIFGFKESEPKPSDVKSHILKKIDLIKEFIV